MLLIHTTTVKYSSHLLTWKHLSKKMLHLHGFKKTTAKNHLRSTSFATHSAEGRPQKSCHLPYPC